MYLLTKRVLDILFARRYFQHYVLDRRHPLMPVGRLCIKMASQMAGSV